MENLEDFGNPKRNPGHEVIFSRHSKAQYLADGAILASDNPFAYVDPENQPVQDLSPEGVEFARKSAEIFFATLDSKRDKIFIVSSSKARAIETSSIYKDVAEEKGFTILQNNEKEGVRVLNTLSLRPAKALPDALFYPDDRMPKINWNTVSAEDKEKWERAHAIVVTNDKGSWGANFHAHASEIKLLFPEFEIEDSQDLYGKQFKKLVRLAEWGIGKAKKSEPDGSVKILAFGHENYFGFALDKYFGDHEIKNCETIAFSPDIDGNMVLERRGEHKTI